MGADRTVPVLTVYGRTYCHLCDDMIAALVALQADHRFDLEVVDVDSDPELEARYGELVPVLVHAGRELCHYRLDAAAVTAHLGGIG
jgi:thiol-disulfide isomerase/thioredoxin